MSDQQRQPDHGPERPSAERALEVLKSLAQPVRRKIVRTLMVSDAMRVSDIAAAIGEPANSVSYHLRQLARIGVAHTTEPAGSHDSRETWWVIDDWHGLSIKPSQISALPGGDVVLAALDQIESAETAGVFSIFRAAAAEAAGLPGLNMTSRMVLTTEEARELVRAVGELFQQADLTSQEHRAHHDEGLEIFDYRVAVMPANSSQTLTSSEHSSGSKAE
ncbi:ArsR/SmtB family transcription factor [Acidipropionibacterium jensenii]|uniref:ArsR/SmtB family transcription factor n=1 Tax=Acidipropionibacterium jensenii TaxID=1749 RepID=UPI00214A94DA